MSVMKVNFSWRSVVTRMQVDPKLHGFFFPCEHHVCWNIYLLVFTYGTCISLRKWFKTFICASITVIAVNIPPLKRNRFNFEINTKDILMKLIKCSCILPLLHCNCFIILIILCHAFILQTSFVIWHFFPRNNRSFREHKIDSLFWVYREKLRGCKSWW